MSATFIAMGMKMGVGPVPSGTAIVAQLPTLGVGQ